MKRKVKELKRIARGNLTGNYMILMKAFIWINAFVMLVEMPFSMLQTEDIWSSQNIIYLIAQILINIIAIILVCGQYKMHLSVARTGKADFKDFFSLLKNQPDRYILANLILFGISLVCLIPTFASLAILYYIDTLVMIVLALVLNIISLILITYTTLTYNLVFYTLLDDENITAIEALKSIRQMMKTHKKRYLYMQFSFLGLFLLNVLSFGIGILWIEPYMTQTTTLFYLDTKGELDAIQTERRKGPAPEPTMFNQYI